MWRRFKIFYRVCRLNRAIRRLQGEQQESLRISRGGRPRFNLFKSIRRSIRRCTSVITERDCFRRLIQDGTIENRTLKSFGFFIFVTVLTYLFYFNFAVIMGTNSRSASRFCIALGFLLTLGISFSEKLRCTIMLFLPQFFSRSGRVILISYAYVLVFSGPMQNIIDNSDIMAASIACGQEMVANQTRMRVRQALAPLQAVVDSVRDMIRSLQEIARKIKHVLQSIAKVMKEIGEAISHSFDWLNAKVFMCNRMVGNAYEICRNKLKEAMNNCIRIMSIFSFLCVLVHIGEIVCLIVGLKELLCLIARDLIKEIVTPFFRMFEEGKRKLEEELAVNITLTHIYNYTLEESKSLSTVKEEVLHSIKSKIEWLTTLIKYTEIGMLLFILVFFYSASKYQKKFKSEDSHDNFFVTKELLEYDIRRCKVGKGSIFPLSITEKMKYVRPSSITLSIHELSSIAPNILVIVLSSMQIGFILLLDYGLFWVLEMVVKHSKLSAGGPVPSYAELLVKGEGLLADMFQKMSDAFGPMTGKVPPMNLSACVPEPVKPNFDRYEQIGMILGIALVLALLQPYGLRLRHVIAGFFYPKRKGQRAAWLYNHIYRNRGDFVKFLRRKIRRTYYGDSTLHDVGFLEYLSSRYYCIRKLMELLNIVERRCLGCGLKDSKSKPLVKCISEDCKALYCQICYRDIGDKCVVCLSPKDYGDISDISEERDSSDEDKDKIDLGKMLTNQKWNEGQLEDDDERTPSYAYIPKERLKRRGIRNWP